MKILLNSLLLTVIFVSGQAYSVPVSTAMSALHLHSACSESKSNEFAKGFCDGAIDAFASAIQDWCVPAEVTYGEVKSLVKSQLSKSVPSATLGALEFVSRAIQKKWPCV